MLGMYSQQKVGTTVKITALLLQGIDVLLQAASFLPQFWEGFFLSSGPISDLTLMLRLGMEQLK